MKQSCSNSIRRKNPASLGVFWTFPDFHSGQKTLSPLFGDSLSSICCFEAMEILEYDPKVFADPTEAWTRPGWSWWDGFKWNEVPILFFIYDSSWFIHILYNKYGIYILWDYVNEISIDIPYLKWCVAFWDIFLGYFGEMFFFMHDILMTCAFQDPLDSRPQDECCICLESYSGEPSKMIRKTPCGRLARQ